MAFFRTKDCRAALVAGGHLMPRSPVFSGACVFILACGLPIAVRPMFHHTATGLSDYVYVVKMAYHKAADPKDPDFTGVFLLIREHRGGRPVSERLINYKTVPAEECDLRIHEDALCLFNRAVLRDRVAFVCDSMIEGLIRRVDANERIANAIELPPPFGGWGGP